MLAGVGGIESSPIRISRQMNRIKPQTREHFDIFAVCWASHVELLPLRKSDKVRLGGFGYECAWRAEEFVRGSFLEGAPMVAVSARRGVGIEHLKQELLRVAHACTDGMKNGAFGFPSIARLR